MKIQQDGRGIREFLISALVAVVISGCSTSREQPPAANTNVAVAPEITQPIIQEAKARAAVTRAVPAAEISSKKNTAAILVQIHQASLKEIHIGKVAQLKASTAEVRAYADQLLQDHANVDQSVVAVAHKMGVHLSDDSATESRKGRHASAHTKAAEQKLNSLSGTDFDRFFLQQASIDHERLIRTLQQEREDASDDSIEALIDKMIPILEQDQELAKILINKEQA